MRIHLLGGLLAGALMTAATGHAQTWENPLQFDAYYYTSSMDSCAFTPQLLYMDNGFYPIYASSVVYHVSQFQIGQIGHPVPPLRPWSVTLTSDDFGNFSPEHVTVPAHKGSYYIVVTGNTEQQSPNCGPFTLTANHY
jgi:hypothetical protein